MNNQKHFVEQTVKQIGYPRWDKMLASKKKDIAKAGRNSSADSTYIYNIPFVRENENYVNASLNLKISGSDTTFGYSCDWQYQYKVHGSPNVDSTAERHAVYFIILDHLTLGHTQFTLLDSNLFPAADNVTSANRRIGIETTTGKYVGRSSEMHYFNYCEYLYHCGAQTSLDCRNGCDFLHCSAPANSPLYCYGIQVCYDGWYDDGNDGGDGGGYEGEGSGAGGNGGSGSGGGTPPNCTPGQNRSAQYPPCESGWEPLEDVPEAINFPNNPCKVMDSLMTTNNFPLYYTNLRNGVTNNYESAFLFKDPFLPSTVYDIIDGQPGTLSINIDPSGLIDGVVHNHYDDSMSLSIFSFDDFFTLYKLFKTGKIKNTKTFTFGMVSNGTAYTMMITDPVAFGNFGNKFLGDSELQDMFIYAFYIGYSIKESNTNAENEASFLKALQGMNTGISLFKANSNISQFDRIKIDENNQVVNFPCN